MLTYETAYVNSETGDTMFELPTGMGFISKTSALMYDMRIDYSSRPENWEGN